MNNIQYEAELDSKIEELLGRVAFLEKQLEEKTRLYHFEIGENQTSQRAINELDKWLSDNWDDLEEQQAKDIANIFGFDLVQEKTFRITVEYVVDMEIKRGEQIDLNYFGEDFAFDDVEYQGDKGDITQQRYHIEEITED